MDTGKLGEWWVSLIISNILENILNRQIMILSLNWIVNQIKDSQGNKLFLAVWRNHWMILHKIQFNFSRNTRRSNGSIN